MLSDEEEKHLLDQARTQPEAFRQLYRHYVEGVFAYVAYRIGSKQDTEDLVSDIFVKVIRNFDQFTYRGVGSFRAWLFRIAYNHVNQFYRTQQTKHTIPLDDLPTIADSDQPIDTQIINNERFQHLRHMINTLSPRRQEILRLRYFAGLRNQDIADLIGIHEKSVASHLSRAIADLQRHYEQAEDTIHE